jgi:hypothetical protein
MDGGNMLKKILISIGLILLTVSFISCSCNPDPAKEAKRRVTMNDIKNEPPMMEDEILLYIKIIPEFAAVKVDPGKEMEFYKKYKLTKNRFYYLDSKIGIASLIINDRPPDLSRFPASAHPNEAELEIVKRHLQAFNTAKEKYRKMERNIDNI